MKKSNRSWRGVAVDAMFIGGAILLSIGAGLCALPLGLMVGGALSIAGATLIARGGD